MYMNSPVLGDGVVFGLSHRNSGQFFGLDAETGKTLWTTKGREGANAAVVHAGSLLFALTDEAVLMRTLTRVGALTVVTAAGPLILAAQAPRPRAMDWTQFGGPGRNFVVETRGLVTTWPTGGPRRLWSRALGEDHSSILVEGDRLYTMYRPLGLMSMLRRSQEADDTAWQRLESLRRQ
jgi:hypothetical protein